MKKCTVFAIFPSKTLQKMIRYTSKNQGNAEEYELPFGGMLDPNNRWIKLAQALPWDELVRIYAADLCEDNGRLGIDARLAIGALIVKHKLGLSDREVIATIQENVYIQYFVGFSSFHPQAAFHPSLFVELRKRMSAQKFERMNEAIIRQAKVTERQMRPPKVQAAKKKSKRSK